MGVRGTNGLSVREWRENMFYKKCLFAIMLAPSVMQATWFAQDRAVVHANHGDWAGAKERLTQAVVDAPDDPGLLYDAGVASYKTGDLSQAAAYFKRATSLVGCPSAIKEQAHFNWGNTCVQQKELATAIEQYETVLKLNPKNEHARHNLEIVKKMLEQQKQQQNKQDQKQDKKDDQKNKDDNQKQDSGNQKDEQKQNQQQNQDKQNQKDEQEKEGDNKQEQEQQKQNQGQDSNQNESGRDKQKQNQQDQQREQKKQEQENRGAQDEQNKKDARDKDDVQSQQQKQSQQDKQQEQKKQEAAAGEQEKEQDSREDGAGQQAGACPAEALAKAGEKQAGTEKKLTGWMAQLLKEQENRDAQVNKRLVQAQVGNKMEGEDGQNCW